MSNQAHKATTKRISEPRLKYIADEVANQNPVHFVFAGNPARAKAFKAGEFDFIGIQAEARIFISTDDGKNWLGQLISSGGLWGIESDSDRAYLADIETEQLDELRGQLHALGFSKRAIAAAFQNVEHA